MKQLHTLLKSTNTAVRAIAGIMVAVVLLFAGYMIWDNNQIFAAAKNVKIDILDAKPETGDDGLPDFSELRRINPDVKLWITLDGTEIDSPVVQGRDNYYYLNHDVFCASSLAGTLFLDARNAGDFSDIYNIIYGHHMKGSLMFGELDYYLDEAFFNANTTGTFILPKGEKKFETVAVMRASDSTREVFKPGLYTDNLSQLCSYIEANAEHIRTDALAKLKSEPGKHQITALVTCTDGSTGTRLILFVMTDYVAPLKPYNPDHDNPGKPGEPDTPGKDEPDGPNNPGNPDNPNTPGDNTHGDEPGRDTPGDNGRTQPDTGYNDHLILWVCITLLSGAIYFYAVVLLAKRKKTH